MGIKIERFSPDKLQCQLWSYTNTQAQRFLAYKEQVSWQGRAGITNVDSNLV